MQQFRYPLNYYKNIFKFTKYLHFFVDCVII